MTVGKAVLKIRQEKGLTQSELGQRARLATSYISRLENNHIQPTTTTLGRLADALNVPVSNIFQVGNATGGPKPNACPVSGTGICIVDQFRSTRGRPPSNKRVPYGQEELRLMRITDFLVVNGPKDVRQALTVVLDSLMMQVTQGKEPTRWTRK